VGLKLLLPPPNPFSFRVSFARKSRTSFRVARQTCPLFSRITSEVDRDYTPHILVYSYQRAGSQSREALWRWPRAVRLPENIPQLIIATARVTEYGEAKGVGTPLARAAASRFRLQFLGGYGKGTQEQPKMLATNKKCSHNKCKKAEHS